MNEKYEFPKNEPSDKLRIWWDRETQIWHIWFGEEQPWMIDSDFTQFNEPLISYERIHESCDVEAEAKRSR